MFKSVQKKKNYNIIKQLLELVYGIFLELKYFEFIKNSMKVIRFLVKDGIF